MDASADSSGNASGDAALRRIAEREDVLEFCYWYHGEGFGDRFTVEATGPFLGKSAGETSEILELLADEGALLRDGAGYRLSDGGRKSARRLFHDTFADFQVGTHGECTAGCCDSEAEAECDHDQLTWPVETPQAKGAAGSSAGNFKAR